MLDGRLGCGDWGWRDQIHLDSRWRGGEGCDGGWRQTAVELERVFSHEDEINQLHEDELVDEDAEDDREDKPAQLTHHEGQVVHGYDLAAYNAAYPNGGKPVDEKKVIKREFARFF